MSRSRAIGLPLVGAILLAACGGGNAASQLAKPPEYNPADQTKCGVAKSQSRPLIVEWNSADRQELESKVRQGVVAVRYQGCEMDVLERCTIPARYGYQGTTRAQDRVVMKDEDDLYAKLPVGAAGLEAKLQRSGQLTVDMNLVGRYEAQRATVSADDLQGDCTGATHFIYALSVGAFDFYAGADADVGGGVSVGNVGGGASSTASRETLTKNGDPDACAKATPDDKAPPAQCGALIRIEVVPLGPSARQAVATPAPPASPQPVSAQAPMPPPPTYPVPAPVSATQAPSGPVTEVTQPPAVNGDAFRDPRRSRLQQRQTALVVNEIQQLESLFRATDTASKDRPMLLRRLAEDYVELEAAAPSTAARSNSAAIQNYSTLVLQYSGATSTAFPSLPPPAYVQIDEATYYLALEYERGGYLDQARRGYLNLITQQPNSKYIPDAYLAFGEMFFREATGDPSKWEVAKQAYLKVIALPPPANTVYGYAWYKLGYVSFATHDLPQTLNAFKKVIDYGTSFSQVPGAAALADEARRQIIPVYAAAGDPAAAYNFFHNLSGDPAGSSTQTFQMMDALGHAYWATRHMPEMKALYTDLAGRDTANKCRWTAFARQAQSALARGGMPAEADVQNDVRACGP
jgi:tetratricopeptide (TPR) repeat protein